MHPLHEIEKEYIRKILEKMGGNKYRPRKYWGLTGRHSIASSARWTKVKRTRECSVSSGRLKSLGGSSSFTIP